MIECGLLTALRFCLRPTPVFFQNRGTQLCSKARARPLVLFAESFPTNNLAVLQFAGLSPRTFAAFPAVHLFALRWVRKPALTRRFGAARVGGAYLVGGWAKHIAALLSQARLGAAVQWVCSADLRLLSAPAAQGAKPRAGAGLTVSRLGGASGRAEREKEREKEKGKGEEEKSEAEKEREERFFYEEKFPELIALMLQTKVVKMGQKQGFEFIEYFNQRGSRKTKAE